MTELFPYLAFEKAKDAIAYYEEVFGAKTSKRLEVSEEQAEQFGMTKEQAAEATMHAEFEVLGVKILCSDSFGRVERTSTMVFHYLLISMSTIKTIQIEFNSFTMKLKIMTH